MKQVFSYIVRLFWLLTWVWNVSGCHHSVPHLYFTESARKLPTRVEGTSDAKAKWLLKRFQGEGVTLITMGQNHLISVASSRLFAGQSPRIVWRGYPILNDIVCYLRTFRKVDVHVSVFTNRYVSPTRERALSSARARAVADYLWSQDIGTRLIFTKGLGTDKPIFSGALHGDRSPNSRIEITFQNTIE